MSYEHNIMGRSNGHFIHADLDKGSALFFFFYHIVRRFSVRASPPESPCRPHKRAHGRTFGGAHLVCRDPGARWQPVTTAIFPAPGANYATSVSSFVHWLANLAMSEKFRVVFTKLVVLAAACEKRRCQNVIEAYLNFRVRRVCGVARWRTNARNRILSRCDCGFSPSTQTTPTLSTLMSFRFIGFWFQCHVG